MPEISLRSSQIVADHFIRSYQKYDALRAEDERAFYGKLDRQFGFESLLLGSKGYKSSDWFKDGNRAFFGGFADVTLSAAVTNDIGIGIAHYNILTLEDVRDFITAALHQNGGVNGTLEKAFADKYTLYRSIGSFQSRFARSIYTLSEAFGQFNQIAQGKSPESAHIIMIGAAHLNPAEGEALTAALNQYIKDAFGSIKGLGTDLHLGNSGGIIIGGKKHNAYPQPRIITYESLTAGLKD